MLSIVFTEASTRAAVSPPATSTAVHQLMSPQTAAVVAHKSSTEDQTATAAVVGTLEGAESAVHNVAAEETVTEQTTADSSLNAQVNEQVI